MRLYWRCYFSYEQTLVKRLFTSGQQGTIRCCVYLEMVRHPFLSSGAGNRSLSCWVGEETVLFGALWCLKVYLATAASSYFAISLLNEATAVKQSYTNIRYSIFCASSFIATVLYVQLLLFFVCFLEQFQIFTFSNIFKLYIEVLFWILLCFHSILCLEKQLYVTQDNRIHRSRV